MAREVKQWITVNGVHVPIFEGQSKEEAVKQAISRQKKRGPVSSDTRKKAVADYVDKKRQYRDAYDRVEIEQRHYDRASNKEDRDAAKDRLKVASKDRDSKLQEYAKASDRVANLGKGGKVRRGTEFGKSGKQGQITHYSDIKQVPKKLKPGEQYALYLKKGKMPEDGGKFAGQTYDAEYQGKGTYGVSNPKDMSPVAGFKTYEAMKKAYEERSQHPGQSYEIAVIKSDDNKNVKISPKKDDDLGNAEDRADRMKIYRNQLQEVQEDIKQFESTKPSLRSPDYDEKLAALKKKEADLKGWFDRDAEKFRAKKTGSPSTSTISEKKATPEDYAKKQGLSLAEMSKQVANHPEASKMASKLMEDGMSYHEAGALAHQTYKDKLSNDSKIESAVTKGSSSEFKNRDEAEAFYRNKFAGVSATYANKMAKKLGIEGRGKDKREALAKHYADQWETRSNVSKNEAEKEKQIARNAEEKKRAESNNLQVTNKREEYNALAKKASELGKKIANTTDPAEKRRLINESHDTKVKMDQLMSNSQLEPVKKTDPRDTPQMHTLTDEEHLRNKVNELNDLHDAAWKHGADTDAIKSQIRQVMDHLPDGTVLARVHQNTNTQYTSQGAVQSQNTKISKLYKINGKWSRYKDGSGAQDDVTSTIIHNTGKWQTLEDAKKEASEKQKGDYVQTKHYGVKEKWQSTNEERNSAIQSLRNSGLSQEDAERKVDRMSPAEIRKLGGTQSTPKVKKIPASQVTISDSQYRFSTGKAPKGYGNWAFYIGNSDEPVFFHGSYAEAKKKAIREAANRGVNKIRVGS